MTDKSTDLQNTTAPAITYSECYAQVFLGDCLELYKNIEPKSIDLILTDLPYGTTVCKWDTIIPFDKLWEMVNYLLKPNGAFITTASQPFTSALVMSNPKMFRYEWIWEKEKPVNIFFKDIQPLKYHENILVFSNAGSHNMSSKKMLYNPQMQQREERNKRNNKPRVNENNGVFGDRRFINNNSTGNNDFIFPKTIQKINTDRNSKLHPTQKPVALFEYLLKTYSNENMTIFDPCMGSGTTGVACKNTNRNFIGIEKDENYFKIAEQRINARTLFS